MISFILEKLNVLTSFIPPPENENSIRRKVLVIHCHPLTDSFSTSISHSVVKGLSSGGHEVKLRRLYSHGNPDDCYDKKSFNPALENEERKSYYDGNNVNTDNNTPFRALKTDIQEAVMDLRWCDSLVFVYPTWCEC